MDVSITDASQYFRGLLILSRRDGTITSREAESVSRLGAKLGFARSFCLESIGDILANEHVDDTPPVFESAEIARKFITDGLTLASADRTMTAPELAWLEKTSALNGFDGDWFSRMCHRATQTAHVPHAWEYDSLSVIHGSRKRPVPVAADQGGA
jgi:hypothetical protein